ncbi:MAG: hypothetical protein ACM37W_20940 [Actinomycetota bacterium]
MKNLTALDRFILRSASPADISSNPYWKSEVGGFALCLRRYVASEFYREYIKKDYPDGRLPQYLDKHTKEFIKQVAFLWGQLWELFRAYAEPELPGEAFVSILLESELLAPLLRYEGLVGGDRTAPPEVLEEIHQQNSQLEKFQNPFKAHSRSWKLTELLIRFGGLSKLNSRRYEKIIGVRTSIASGLTGEHLARVADLHASGKTRPEKRGRTRSKRAVSAKARRYGVILAPHGFFFDDTLPQDPYAV